MTMIVNKMNMVKHLPNNELQEIALEIRRDIISMIFEAGSGHPGGSLSVVEILVALYFGLLERNDKFYLSNGHVCPALYAVMARRGFFDKKLLGSYASLGSPLQGHPERIKLNGMVNTSGPLGLGLAQAAGYAAIKPDVFVYCLTSDGEHDEGNHYEAINFAAKYNLENLIQFVDRNGVQIEGTVEEIMPLGDLKERYIASGWEAIEIDGHNFDEIFETVRAAKENRGKPTVIIANTVFGKGVSYMESNPDWHAKAPNQKEYDLAMQELV